MLPRLFTNLHKTLGYDSSVVTCESKMEIQGLAVSYSSFFVHHNLRLGHVNFLIGCPGERHGMEPRGDALELAEQPS